MHPRGLALAVMVATAVVGCAGWYVLRLPPTAAGTVLFTIRDKSALSVLTGSGQPALQDGAFVLKVSTQSLLGPGNPGWLALPGTYADAEIDATARLAGNAPSQYLVLGCRFMGAEQGYTLTLFPSAGRAWLSRRDPGGVTALTPPERQFLPLLQANNQGNHLSLSCVGFSISGAINGITVVRTTDRVYRAGKAILAVTGEPEPGPEASGRFSDVVVIRP